MRGRIVACTIATLLVTILTAPQGQSVDVEIADVAPRHVDYPKGPTVILRNRAKKLGFEAWVVRHLDGVVVKRYTLPAVERWEEQLEIAPKGVALPGQAKGSQTTVPFALLVVAATGEVKASAPFDARVSPSKPRWPTAGGDVPTTSQLVASGEVVATHKAAVTIRDSEGSSKTYRLTEDTMTWGWKGTATEPKPSKGDRVSLIYTYQDGQYIAKQIAYRPPGDLPNPWAPGLAYVGTVKTAAALTPGGDAFVIETTKYDGRWLVDKSTDKVFSPSIPSLKEILPGTLVGFRVEEGAAGAKAPVLVARFFVLTRAFGG